MRENSCRFGRDNGDLEEEARKNWNVERSRNNATPTSRNSRGLILNAIDTMEANGTLYRG